MATRRKPKRPHLPPQALEMIAGRFKALSDPLRLRLIMALEEGERSVNELVNQVGSTQTNVSRHLQALARAAVVNRRKAGNHAYYGIADPTIFELCDHVCGSLARALERQSEANRWLQ